MPRFRLTARATLEATDYSSACRQFAEHLLAMADGRRHPAIYEPNSNVYVSQQVVRRVEADDEG